MIAVHDVTKVYTLSRENRVLAVDRVSLEIQPGEFVVITGRSGSGKTTLLNLIAGLTPPTSGRVLFEGVDLWTLKDRQQSLLRNQKFGFIFQFPSLLPSLTTLENTALASVFGVNGAHGDTYERAADLLRTVGLGDKLGALPRQLSAGQQQRVVVARALLNRPEILLADEPTSDLDEQTEREIMDLFAEIHAQTRVTILMVTHSTELIRYGTRSIRMASGRIVEENGLSTLAKKDKGAI
jgi:putative ABC transport system ATP-binding protein/lipoprotein-releasing system ATP-binding protein